MISVTPPFFYRWLSPEHLVCDLPGPEKVIYLTFDDGPIPEVTPGVLSILGEYGAAATFFVVGDNVRRYPGIFEQILLSGHAAGNHTYHHLNGWITAPGAYADDVMRCSSLVKSSLFRPPYGRITPSQFFLLRKDYRIILWSVLSCDFDRRTSPPQCLQNTLDHTHNGSIVVFHDNIKAIVNLQYALPKFLEHFSKLGYRFARLDDPA